MTALDSGARRILALGQADSSADWSPQRAERVMRALETRVALGDEAGEARVSWLWRGLLAATALTLGAATFFGAHEIARRGEASDTKSPTTATFAPTRVDEAAVRASIERLMALRAMLEGGEAQQVLTQLKIPRGEADELFAEEFDRLEARARCALSETQDRDDQPEGHRCLEAELNRLLSHGR